MGKPIPPGATGGPAAWVSDSGGSSFWNVPLEGLQTSLTASTAGLTTPQAQRRLTSFGANEVAQAQHMTARRDAGSFLLNPLVLILLVASLIAGVLGDVTDAGIIALIVLLSVGLNFFQTYRSQRAAEALRHMVATHATVLRDGAWAEIPIAEIVPGDIVGCRPAI